MASFFDDTFGQFPTSPTPVIAHDPGPGQFVQGGMFGGLTFAPLSDNPTFGPQGPASVPSLPSDFAPSSTSPGATIVSQGSSSGGSAPSVGPTFAPLGQAQPSNAQAGAQPQPASGVASGSLADYFLRAVIVILGFIFVAIGLNMFKPGIIPVPIKGLKK